MSIAIALRCVFVFFRSRVVLLFFFFFSSRRRHTRSDRDWSSDVCSSDLAVAQGMYPEPPQLFHGTGVTDDDAWESYWKVENGIRMSGMPGFKGPLTETRSEERRVGKECRSRWSPYH